MEELRAKLLGWVVLPPGEERTVAEIVDALLEGQYYCADHAREEGSDGLLAADAFQWRRVKPSKRGGQRYGAWPQGYCRRHQSIRNGAAQRRRLDKPEARAAQTERTMKSRPRERLRRNAEQRAARVRDPLRIRKNTRNWEVRHPEARKRSQDAWRARERMKNRPRSGTESQDRQPPEN